MAARNRIAIVSLLLACCHAGTHGNVRASDPTTNRFANAVEVRRFTFEYEDDRDYDGQPDDWTHRRGRGFPIYVRAGIDRTRGADSKHSLRFDLNGGRGAYYSPKIRVNSQHSYILRGQILTDGLEHDAGVITISFLDHRRQRIGRMVSQAVTGTFRDWQTVSIGPFNLDPQVQFVVIGTHVVESERRDVRGSVWFDNIWLGSLPQLEVSISSGRHYFATGDDVFVEARATGVAATGDHRLKLQLFDSENNRLNETTIPLHGAPHAQPEKPQEQLNPLTKPIGPEAEPPAVRTLHRWNLSQHGFGFYRVHATLERDNLPLLEKETTFVVTAPIESSKRGEFGWAVVQTPASSTLAGLGEAVIQSGSNWLKFPLWTASQPRESNFDHVAMTQLLDRLESEHVTFVGMLSDPPSPLGENCGQTCDGVSRIFVLPRSYWYRKLEPVIARYAFRVRHWQLGGDIDNSFVGLPTLQTTVNSVKVEFDRIGHDTRFGYHWDWTTPFPSAAAAAGNGSRPAFMSISNRLPLGADELQEALQTTRDSGATRWVLIEALPTNKHTPRERAADLVRKMIAAKIGGAEGIFLLDPFHPQRGTLQPDGSPSELFLPWRTAATLLRGGVYLGSLDLPLKSPNAAIATPSELVMFAWNPQPTMEEFYLGESLTATDLWGRPHPVQIDAATGRRIVELGPTPIVLRGCSSPIARWLLSVRFEKGKLRSEYGGHEEAILGVNTFPQGVTGNVTLHMPHEWIVEPRTWPLQAGVGEKFRLPTLLTFPPNASLGQLRPTIDFEIQADRPYRFTMHLPYELGLGDLNLIVNGRRLPDGRYEVEQRIVNNTSEVFNFNCSLFIPGQIRQKQVVTKLGRGEDKRFYYLPGFEELRGKDLWLRAEQIDGRRLLNYRLKVKE